jgi:glycosyltransferase involved in cell wall biosynthesis
MMRLAFATTSEGRVGGLETYLEAVLPEVVRLGHQVALWAEAPAPPARARLSLPGDVRTARLESPAAALALCEAWRPDAVLVQGLDNADTEAALLGRPGSVFVAHNYAGVCISGTRAWTRPIPRPCHRRFGPGCLGHYFPHGCGGRSPLTMLRRYRREMRRQAALADAPAIVTLSSHMRRVLIEHGMDAQRIFHVPFGPAVRAAEGSRMDRSSSRTVTLSAAARLEPLKGLHLLLEALDPLQKMIAAPVRLVVVGDGSARKALERQAAAVHASNPEITIAFTGWSDAAERDRVFAVSDLIVMPSVWPEPLGLSGMEAGRLGVPVVGFDVGGISDWLHDRVNGRLASGDPPTSAGLAAAMADVLGDPADHHRLSRGALAANRDATPRAHARALIEVARRLPGLAAAC